jgi:hypothetical protein
MSVEEHRTFKNLASRLSRQALVSKAQIKPNHGLGNRKPIEKQQS